MTRRATTPEQEGVGSAAVQVLNEAITAAMREFGVRHGCGPMHWHLSEVNGFYRGEVIGFPGSSEGDLQDGVRVAQQWATLLGLDEWVNEMSGYRSWLGVVGTSRVEIWCRTTTRSGGS